MSSRPELRLDWCTHEAAKYAVENWHYSKRMPKSKLAKIGVWENSKFIGVVIYGVGATSDLVKRYGLRPEQGCELVRVALREHETPVSRILAISFRMLKSEFKKLRIVVSFADANQRHVGSIYQAGNWVYSGLAQDSGGSVIINGEQVHGRSVGLRYGTRSITWLKENVDSNARPAPTLGKHRYLMPLDDEIRQRIEPLRKPYPKRVRSEDSGTSGNQPEGGGANPTRTLHNSSA